MHSDQSEARTAQCSSDTAAQAVHSHGIQIQAEDFEVKQVLGLRTAQLPQRTQVRIPIAGRTVEVMQREPSSTLGTCVGHAGLQQHTQLISHCSQLLYCSRFWDVAFTCQNGELVHANRAFLAARSEFFRGLLFGGLQETYLAEIALPKVKAAPLRLVLHFLHTLEVRSTGGH